MLLDIADRRVLFLVVIVLHIVSERAQQPQDIVDCPFLDLVMYHESSSPDRQRVLREHFTSTLDHFWRSDGER